MSLYLCVPVLKRYDLLRDMLESLQHSTLKPAKIYIVDNGRDLKRLTQVIASADVPVEVHVPDASMGLAETWNWFIDNVSEERLICNDDLLFASDSLQQIVDTAGDFVSPLATTNACSCFLLRDSCVKAVGMFDETISPGYAYFEDCDYVERMLVVGLRITSVSCGVTHVGSATIAKNSEEEWTRHHDKFLQAQANFVAKWGRMPDLGRAL